MKNKHVIVVGGGIAGLTAVACLVLHVTLLEKENHTGGLVSSFERDGYIFDGGLRAVESSGLILSVLQELGIDLPLVHSTVSLGIEDIMIPMKNTDDILTYKNALKTLYPASADNVDVIINDIQRVSSYMMVLLGNEAPVYKNEEEKKSLKMKDLLSWLMKLLKIMPKLGKLQYPVEEHLAKITEDQALIDIIIQHFFKKTPTSFALSYFLFYLDYHYPVGGTGAFPKALENYIREGGGQVITDCRVVKVDPENKKLTDEKGAEHLYDELIWTADNKTLYNMTDTQVVVKKKIQKRIEEKRDALQDLRGAESVLSVYLGVDLPPSYFSKITTEHVFYTPDKRGLSLAKTDELLVWLKEQKPDGNLEQKNHIKNFLKDYFNYNTFEISFPVLRDASLAPKDKTGLIASCLFNYDLCKFISDSGWYDEFKIFCEDEFIRVLDGSIFNGLKEKIDLRLSATPLTLERHTGNTDGAIVGWSFENPFIPVPQSMIAMPNAIKTVIPHVYQAGQWSYSPAGVPISLLTGKVVAGHVAKKCR